MAKECRVPWECMKNVSSGNDTDSYSNPSWPIVWGQICDGYDGFAGPFGECMEQIRANRPSQLVYPCAKYIGSMGDNLTDCEFYKSGKYCARTLLTDRCGEEIAGELEKNSELLMGQFRCKNETGTTTTTTTTTTSKPKTTTVERKKFTLG